MSDKGGKRMFVVSSSPHIRHPESIPRVMWTVFGLLLGPAVAGCLYFGRNATGSFNLWPIFIIVCSVLAAIATEALILRLRGKDVKRALDGSAAVTGMLFGLVISPHVPWYVVVTGAVVAVGVGKHLFGGLGHNIWNPALVGRAFVLMAWASAMTGQWPLPGQPDVVSQPTPLMAAKTAKALGWLGKGSIVNHLFVGSVPGSLGETSALVILLAGIFLILFKYIDWRVPLIYIVTTVVLCMLIPYRESADWFRKLSFWEEMGFWAFSGGLFLGAFFMATDMVTSPITPKGRVIFALGCGVLTAVIRKMGGYPEGVCYSILIMNTCVPLIDRFTKPRRFGTVTFYEPPAAQADAAS